MTQESITIIAVGVGLAGITLTVAGFVWAAIRDLSRRIDEQRVEIVTQITHRIDRMEDRIVLVEDR